ncbi:MAG: hypothetical protein ACI9DC_001388 [Gammaproteobacteria bacterium]
MRRDSRLLDSDEYRCALSTQTQATDQVPVAVDILIFQIVEQFAALADHLKQTLSGMMIMRMGAEVVRQVRNTRRQQSHLNFGRTRVRGAAAVIFEDLFFLDGAKRHEI